MKPKKYLKEIKKTLNPNADCWEHFVLGLVDEVGEIAKLFKKAVQAGDDGNVDRVLLLEELGDLDYFKTQLQDLYGFSDKEVKAANIAKLKKRYPKGYTAKDDLKRMTDEEIDALVESLTAEA